MAEVIPYYRVIKYEFRGKEERDRQLRKSAMTPATYHIGTNSRMTIVDVDLDDKENENRWTHAMNLDNIISNPRIPIRPLPAVMTLAQAEEYLNGKEKDREEANKSLQETSEEERDSARPSYHPPIGDP